MREKLKKINMPANWLWVELKELTEDPKNDIVDGPFGSNLKANEYVESGTPVFKIQNIKANNFLDKNICYITPQKAEQLKRHTFKKDDLIITKLGNPLGLCCKVPRKYSYGVIVADLMRFRPSPQRVYDKYLIYGINSILVQSQFKSITKGTTRPRVNLTIVREINFPLAPLPEQRAIVAKIEQLFSELDNGIANLKTAKDKLEIYRQAVLKKAFEGLKKTPFGKIISSSQNGLSKRKGLEGTNVKVLRLADIQNFEISEESPRLIKLTAKELKKYQLKKNNLVVIRVNGSKNLVGQLIHVSESNESEIWAFCDHFIRLSIESEFSLSKFYFYYFQQHEMRKYIHENMVSSAGQNTVSQTTIKAAQVPLVTLQEQTQIVKEIETRLSVCDNAIKNIDEALKKSEALRQSILKKAFEGKLLSDAELQACRQEPDWEPAEKLLERIRKEKK